MVAETKLYDVLGVQPSADEAEIRRAYKTKAMRHHPDKNPDDPTAHDMFQQIGAAYETLSDPDRRAAYDRYGSESQPAYGPSTSSFDPDDLFAEFFGGMGGGGFSFNMDNEYASGSRSQRQRPPQASPDTQVELELTLEEAYVGKTVNMSIERERTCAACEGVGSKKGAKARMCGRCEGEGSVMGQQQIAPAFIGNIRMACPSCAGTGSKFREKDQCKRCEGKKVVKQKKKLSVVVEAGSLDAERIVLPQKGDQVPGCPPGDIILNLSVKPHHSFATGPPSSPHLYFTTSITLSEALLGFNRLLCYHLDGRAVKVRSDKGERVIQRHDVYRIPGEGMRRSHREGKGRDGDLFIRFEVELPTASWARAVAPGSLDVSLPPGKPDIADSVIGAAPSNPVKLESVPNGTPFYFAGKMRDKAGSGSKFERTAYEEKLREQDEDHTQDAKWREEGGMCTMQ